MSKKPTCVNLDRNLILIVQGYPLQIENISEILNNFLLALASEEEEMTPSQIKSRVWEIAQGMRKRILEQRKLIQEEENKPAPVDQKIRCYDIEEEVFRLVPVSEIRAFPERFDVDEKVIS